MGTACSHIITHSDSCYQLNFPQNFTHLQPDAHFTYGVHENWTHLFRDISENTCGLVPCHVLGVAVWAQDDQMSDDDDEDQSDDAGGHPPDVSTAPVPDPGSAPVAPPTAASSTDAVPAHPDALPVGPARQVLPIEVQQQLELNLNAAVQPVIQHLRRTGLTEEDAVNVARNAAWNHIRGMGGLSTRHTKSRRTGNSESSRWY